MVLKKWQNNLLILLLVLYEIIKIDMLNHAKLQRFETCIVRQKFSANNQLIRTCMESKESHGVCSDNLLTRYLMQLN